jgi:hypothetical protein
VCEEAVEIRTEGKGDHRQLINGVKVDNTMAIFWHDYCAAGILLMIFLQGKVEDQKARALHVQGMKYFKQGIMKIKNVPQEFLWVV